MQFNRRQASLPAVGLSRRLQWRIIVAIFAAGVLFLPFELLKDGAQPNVPAVQLPENEQPENLNLPLVTSDELESGPNSGESPPGLAQESPDTIRSSGLTVGELRVFEDNTLDLSRAEGAAFYNALRTLRKTRNTTLSRIARNDVAYTVMMADPDRYRGEVIELTGDLRRLTRTPIKDGIDDFDQLLEGWLFTADSDVLPYRVVLLSADDEIPRAESFPPVPVRLNAVFLKRQSYLSNAGGGVAPLMIAKTITRLPPPPTLGKDRLTPLLTAAISIAMAAIFAAFLMTLRRQSRRKLEFRMDSAQREGPGDIACEPPAEFLAILATKELDTEELEAAERDTAAREAGAHSPNEELAR